MTPSSSAAARDHYATLGLARNASESEIKAAYRKLALRHHPDRNPGDSVAEEQFKAVSMAYAVLSDPQKRAHYDRFGDAEEEGFDVGAELENATKFFNSILGDLFGLDRSKKAGQDLRYALEIDFVEAALGTQKTIEFDRSEDCRACAGTGAEGAAAGLIECGACAGQGHVRHKGLLLTTRRTCATCGGTGQVPKIRCSVCLGSGLEERRRSFSVRIPPRTLGGTSQRVAGEGSPGRRGGANGDLHVTIRVSPHPFFSEQEGRLVCKLPISLQTAVFGGAVDVPVLDGFINMKIPPGTQPGAIFRVRGHGLPGSREGASRGDLHVHVEVEIPRLEPSDARLEAGRLALQDVLEALPESTQPQQKAFGEACAEHSQKWASSSRSSEAPAGRNQGTK